jgi:hypothetical protein
VRAHGLVSCADAGSPAAPPQPSAEAPGSAAAASKVLDVTCDGETTALAATSVQAQADGVHVRIENTSDARVLTQWEARRRRRRSGDIDAGAADHAGNAEWAISVIRDERNP